MNVKQSLLIGLIIGLMGCKQNSELNNDAEFTEPTVISFHNKLAYAEFSKLNLDDKRVNLFDPGNT
jgi:hypothetical protein